VKIGELAKASHRLLPNLTLPKPSRASRLWRCYNFWLFSSSDSQLSARGWLEKAYGERKLYTGL